METSRLLIGAVCFVSHRRLMTAGWVHRTRGGNSKGRTLTSAARERGARSIESIRVKEMRKSRAGNEAKCIKNQSRCVKDDKINTEDLGMFFWVTWIFRFLASTTHRWSRSGTMRNLRRRFFTTAPTALRHRRCASSDGCFAATSKFFFKKLSIVSAASLHSLSTRDRSASSSLKPAAHWWGAVPVGQAFSFRSSRCGTAKTGTDLSQ